MEKYFFILILFVVVQFISNLVFKKFILEWLEDLKKLMFETEEESIKSTKINGFIDQDKEEKDV